MSGSSLGAGLHSDGRRVACVEYVLCPIDRVARRESPKGLQFWDSSVVDAHVRYLNKRRGVML